MATTNPGQARDAFPATRWSMATQALGAPGKPSTEALGELGARYRYPVYAYVRCCGHTPAIAQDIAGSFLRDLHLHVREQPVPRGIEHFRRFLIERLQQWLGGDWHQLLKDSEGETLIEDATLEARRARDCRPTDSPERAFQRAFALEVLHRALARLHAEARQTGHPDMYAALVPLLGHDPSPAQRDDIARALRMRPLTLVVALKRLRQRLRELAREELADTVASADDLAAEQETLLAILQSTD